MAGLLLRCPYTHAQFTGGCIKANLGGDEAAERAV